MFVGKRKLSHHFGRAIFIALHRCFRTSSLHLRLKKALVRLRNFATLEHRLLSGMPSRSAIMSQAEMEKTMLGKCVVCNGGESQFSEQPQGCLKLTFVVAKR
jgi:hypothetical protein